MMLTSIKCALVPVLRWIAARAKRTKIAEHIVGFLLAAFGFWLLAAFSAGVFLIVAWALDAPAAWKTFSLLRGAAFVLTVLAMRAINKTLDDA